MKRFTALILAFVLVLSLSATVFATGENFEKEETLAASLKTLSIFRGVSENDFALMRAPTRTEALVMLVRLLGEEEKALSYNGHHPFEDVPEWADRYVGYAYEKELTKGVSENEFGSELLASEEMYLTFVLRALGYSDTEGDFSWDDPYSLANKAGIISEDKASGEFLRAAVVSISASALSASICDTEMTLAEKLISQGVFTKEQYEAEFGKAENEKEEVAEEDKYAFIKPEGELFVDDLNLSSLKKPKRAFELMKLWIRTNADFFHDGLEYLVYRNKTSEDEVIYRMIYDKNTDDIRIALERFPQEGGSYLATLVLSEDGKTVARLDYYTSRRTETPSVSAYVDIDREDIYPGMGIEFDEYIGGADREREHEQKAQELFPEVVEFIDNVMSKNLAFYGCGSASSLGFEI